MARFTPGQLCEALALTKETFRYWKKEFPGLLSAQGARACFGPADLLAAAIVKQLTSVGLPVRRIAPVVPAIHDECKNRGWFPLERQTLLLHLESARVEFSSETHLPHAEPTLSIPLAPIVAALRAYLLQEDDYVEQRSLALGPLPISRGVRA